MTTLSNYTTSSMYQVACTKPVYSTESLRKPKCLNHKCCCTYPPATIFKWANSCECSDVPADSIRAAAPLDQCYNQAPFISLPSRVIPRDGTAPRPHDQHVGKIIWCSPKCVPCSIPGHLHQDRAGIITRRPKPTIVVQDCSTVPDTGTTVTAPRAPSRPPTPPPLDTRLV